MAHSIPRPQNSFRRTAIIIGASSGIGEALAHQLSREGWRVGLMARRVDRLETIRDAIGLDAVVHYMDVSRREDRSAQIEWGLAPFPRPPIQA